MNEQEANKFVIDTFQSEYDDVKFRKFINELLNGGELKYGSVIPATVKAPYSDFIKDYKFFGVYTDSNGKRILFVSVHLIRKTSQDRARVMQRNFAADLLRGNISKVNGGDSALIAFYDDVGEESWRLSFVTLETRLVCDEKGVRVSERISPAKRSSFLVGVHEPCHTCMKRFSPLIKEGASYPTLEQITDSVFQRTGQKEER